MASAPAAPPAPDPAATAAAQSASNIKSATAQSEINNVNQVTPQGNLTYTQSGTNADGTPQFTATTSYSPGEQQLFDTGLQTQQNLANIGTDQSAKIGALLDTPFNTDTATADKIQGLQNEFLDPQWQKQGAALDTQLANQGILPGSDAYNTAQLNFSNQRQQGYDQSYLDSYNTGQQAALTQRNQPINEISALLSGSQVSQPSFTNTPQSGVAPTDVIGATGQSLAQQNVGYQGQLAQSMGINSGLFGLGGAALGGLTSGGLQKGVSNLTSSDRRLKENIKRIGTADNGLPIYLFTYKSDPSKIQMGVMAQDVLGVHPRAVDLRPDGYMTVNYEQALA